MDSKLGMNASSEQPKAVEDMESRLGTRTSSEDPDAVEDMAGDLSSEPSQHYTIICNVCRKYFHSATELLEHLIHKHITLRPHQCKLCDFSCTNRTDLASHMTMQHDQILSVNKK